MQSTTQTQIYPPPLKVPRTEHSLQRKLILSGALLLATVIVVGAVQAFGPIWAGTLFRPVKLDGLKGFTALLGAFVTVLVLHEGGHLAAAMLMNFQVLGITLGPIRITRLHGQSNLVFSPKRLFTGSVSAIPLSFHRWRTRVLIVIAAGPVATLLSAALAQSSLHSLRSDSWLGIAFSLVVELSIIILLLGLFPNGTGAGIRNDAQLFWCLLRNPVSTEEIFLYHRFSQLRILGVRPKDYPEDLISKAAASQGRPDMALYFAGTVLQYAIDRGNIELADAWDRRAMELQEFCRGSSQQLAIAQSACFDILFRNDSDSARSKLAGVKIQALSPAWLRHRVKATQLLADGRLSLALSEISRATSLFPGRFPCYDFEQMLLKELEQKAATAS